ncbi:WD40 repeat domain-containing protein [Alteromonas sp. ASW11-36]|uniref:WD40 repeat domain-containing protein n=1 Tax=Alteromonas arenosi TaxID=3055817 RepID=A0ABT7ST62_9ALTE|nr:WD40 repeat domain-containing protein [Alteromonas sp. ASW11-36]MDM7859383.1 WD40 repeat domain-containing protein [Alteromonas sp. ASW11-36]
MKKNVRIFISSPNDVEIERQIALQVIQRLARKYNNSINLKAILWEREPLLASGHFQDALDPSTADIAICLLWSRLGSPLPEQFKSMDGRTGITGTEWEFERALAAFEEHQKPDLLVYRKTAKVSTDIENLAQAKSLLEQKQKVEDFFQRYFHYQDEFSTFRRAYFSFDNAEDFELLLESHLQPLIEKHVIDASNTQNVTWFEGSPFAGLAAYEEHQHSVFFGRTKAIGEVMSRYKRLVERGSGFIMISGMSGSGKSSLVNAGLLPLIRTPRVVSFDVAYIDVTRFSPRQLGHSKGPLYALCELFLAQSQATVFDIDAETLFEQLKGSPKSLASTFMHATDVLAQQQTLHQNVACRFQLIIDQSEEIFTLAGVGKEQLVEFWQGIAALVNTGFVWVLGSIRSDMVGQGQNTPLFDLMQGEGDYKLAPPSATEIRQIIAEPAAAAGVSFEVDKDGRSLADVIFEDSQAQLGSLPLVAFCLNELFELAKNTENAPNLLSFNAYYNKLGGLAGAISKRAESIVQQFQAQGYNLDTELPYFFNAFIRVCDVTADGSVTARVVPPAAITRPEQQALIEAFVDARLIVHTESYYRFAHEALISKWHRIQKWIGEDRSFQAFKAQIEEDVSIWQREGQPTARLLNRGKMLDEAETWMDLRRDDFLPTTIDYLQHSIDKCNFSKRRRIAAVIAVFISLCVLTLYSWQQQQKAQQNYAQALQNQSLYLAEQARDQYERGRTDTAMLLALNALPGLYGGDRPHQDLADVWLSLATSNNRVLATFTHEGWVNDVAIVNDGKYVISVGDDGIAYVWDIEQSTIKYTWDHGVLLERVVVSPNQEWVVTVGYDHGVRLWSMRNGLMLSELIFENFVDDLSFTDQANRMLVQTSAGELSVIAIDADGTMAIQRSMLNISAHASSQTDGKFAALQDDGGVIISALEASGGNRLINVNGDVHLVAIDAQAAKLAIGTADGQVTIWTIAQGQQLHSFSHEFGLETITFSPNSQILFTSDLQGTGFLWDLSSGKLLTTLGHTRQLNSAAFNRDGTQLVTGSRGNSVSLWDVATGELLQRGWHNKDIFRVHFADNDQRLVSASGDGTAILWQIIPAPINFMTHQDALMGAVISPLNRYLGTASDDKTGVLWDIATGQSKFVMQHSDSVYMLSFSADEKRVASSSLDGLVRIWSTETGELLAQVEYAGGVWESHFSADGNRLYALIENNVAEVTDIATNETLISVASDIPVHYIALNSAGNLLAIGNEDGVIELWSLPSQEKVHQFSHEREIWNLAFSPRDDELASVGADHKLIVWDLNTGQKRFEYSHRDTIWDVNFSPDGSLLLTGSWDNTASVIDRFTGEERHVLRHADDVNWTRFTQDGEHIVTYSNDGTAALWETDSGERVGVITYSGAPQMEAIASDGEKVITIAPSGVATVHTFSDVFSVSQAVGQLPINRRCLSAAEREDFFLLPLTAQERAARRCEPNVD